MRATETIFIHLFCGYSCEEVRNYYGKTQNSPNKTFVTYQKYSYGFIKLKPISANKHLEM